MSFDYNKDADNIVTITIDMPGRKQNVINREFGEAMLEVLERLDAEQELAGVVITSAKKDFVAGADIDMLFSMEEPKEAFDALEQLKAGLRRLETLGKPVVAAMNGTALGGGYDGGRGRQCAGLRLPGFLFGARYRRRANDQHGNDGD